MCVCVCVCVCVSFSLSLSLYIYIYIYIYIYMGGIFSHLYSLKSFISSRFFSCFLLGLFLLLHLPNSLAYSPSRIHRNPFTHNPRRRLTHTGMNESSEILTHSHTYTHIQSPPRSLPCSLTFSYFRLFITLLFLVIIFSRQTLNISGFTKINQILKI